MNARGKGWWDVGDSSQNRAGGVGIGRGQPQASGLSNSKTSQTEELTAHLVSGGRGMGIASREFGGVMGKESSIPPFDVYMGV